MYPPASFSVYPFQCQQIELIPQFLEYSHIGTKSKLLDSLENGGAVLAGQPTTFKHLVESMEKVAMRMEQVIEVAENGSFREVRSEAERRYIVYVVCVCVCECVWCL